MGDLKALMEQAQGVVDESSAEETARKIMSGRFTLKDMYDQMKMVSDMGPLGKILQYIPGVGGKMSKEQMEAAQTRIKQFKVIMNSMTAEEMENPRIIKAARIRRIARGAGVEPADVRALLKQYDQSRKMVKKVTSDRQSKRQLMKMLGDQGME
jgi:signal recognition particle subunit SRP54